MHCLLYEFLKNSTASEAFKNICVVYTDAVKACTSQLWLKRFKNGEYDILNKLCSRKQLTLNEEILKESVEFDPH